MDQNACRLFLNSGYPIDMEVTPSKAFSSSMLHSQKERWVCVYPVYLNSRATRAKGRKIAIEQAVDNPKHTEICAILHNMGLQHLAENKVCRLAL